MKTSIKQIVAYIFSALILFQGCTVYKSVASLDEAYKSGTKVKIETYDNQTLKFNRLEFENGNYIGVKESYKDDAFNQSKKDIIRIPVNVNDVDNVKIKDKTMSIILPFAIPVVLLAGLLIVGGAFGSF